MPTIDPLIDTLLSMSWQDWQTLLFPGALRWVVLGMLMSGAGTAFAALWFEPEVARKRFRWRVFWLGLLGGMALCGLIYYQLEQLGSANSEVIRKLYVQSLAWQSHRLMLAASACLIISAVLPSVLFRLNLLALPLLAVGISLSGHTLSLGSLSGVALALHVAIGALWLGHLVPLSELCRRSMGPALGLRVRLFSKAATLWVPLMLVLGGWLTYQLIPRWESLINTPYGQALSLKMAAMVLVMVLSVLNKWMYSPFVGGRGSSRWMLAGSSRWQCRLLLWLVLGTTAWLSSQYTPPAY